MNSDIESKIDTILAVATWGMSEQTARDRKAEAKAALLEIFREGHIEELKWVVKMGSITNHCDDREYQIEKIEIEERLAELQTHQQPNSEDKTE